MGEELTDAIRAQRNHGHLAVIAELKRRRAEGTDLFRGRSATEIAQVYQTAGATAVSVVTSASFGGSMRLLGEVAAAQLGLPILRKDLIRTERDIEASKGLGASAVLLVLPLLGLPRLIALLQAARDCAVEPFVEVANRQEIEQVRAVHAGIIAISNADIETLEQDGDDISRSIALIERSDPRLWISASRLSGPSDIRALAAAGFDGALVGTHLLLADDLRKASGRMVAAAEGRDVPP